MHQDLGKQSENTMQYNNSERSPDTAIQLQTLCSTIQGLAQSEERSKTRQEEVEQVAMRLSQHLQRSLNVQDLLQFFCQEIATVVPCDSTSYQNLEQNLVYTHGNKGSHICHYNLELEGEYLGDLICTRNKPFGDQDLLIIESLAGYLVYPLRNALMYRVALNLAMQDPLTGAGNKKALEQAIKREQNLFQRYDTPFSMLFIDIDDFKKINDQHGRATGDLALQNIYSTITGVIRQSDQVFRFGGEEFVVLLNNTQLTDATFLAERIRGAIEVAETSVICPRTLTELDSCYMTVSIGVVNFHASEDMDSLFNRADEALYNAKESGCNQVCIAA